MSYKSLPILIVLLALVMAVAGCAPVPAPLGAPQAAATATPVVQPTEAPVAPTPAVEPTLAPAGPNGQVTWNDAPVPGAPVKLAKSGTCRDAGNEGVLATTVTSPDGKFAFASVPDVEWDICYAWPESQGDGVFMIGERKPVMPVNDLALKLTKPLRLLAPDLANPVAAPVEVRWEGLDEAVTYRVVVSDMGTSELAFQQDVPETGVTVMQPLEPGHGYSLSVGALNGNGEQIAFFWGEFSTAPSTAAPEAEPVTQVPSNCVREGLPTYVDRDTRLCFAYPQGFAFEGPQGSYAAGSQARAELRGPAIGSGSEPLFARLSLDYQPYQGTDLEPFVDEMIKRDVPADLAPTVKRTLATWGGHGAEVLEPWPGQLSARVVVIDVSPEGYHILTFWPSFADTPADQLSAEALQAQKDMDSLYQVVSETFATLPPPGVPIASSAAADLPASQPPSTSGTVSSQPYRGVSFAFPAPVAAAAQGATVPAQGSADGPWWEFSPQHVEFTFDGYAHPESTQTPRVAVYDAKEFASLSQQAAEQVVALQKLLAAKPEKPEGALPFLPLANAVQQMQVLPEYLAFKGGEGIRYLTQYAQGPVPINNGELFYTFQGLTSDGKYYVSAVLPVSHPALPPTAGAVPALLLDGWVANWTGYLSDVTGTLSSHPDAGLKPALADLDALVQSIEIQPDALAPATAALSIGVQR